MEVKIMSASELEDLYANHMFRDFPAPEIKPLSTLKQLLSTGEYVPLAFIEDGQMIGYTLLIACDGKNACLLDYFAVCSGIRGQGIGSRIFALIRESLQPGETLFIEAEKPNEEDPATLTIRQRRIAFYRRNGATMSGVLGWAFGVCYRLLYCGNHISDDDVEQGMKAVYASLLSPASFQANIRFHRD